MFCTYLYNWALQFHIFVYLLFSQYKSFQSSNDFLKIKTWVFVNWSAVGGCACRSGDVFEVNRWNVSGTKPARSLPSLWGKPRQIIRELTATKIEWGRFSLFCVCVRLRCFFLRLVFSLSHTVFLLLSFWFYSYLNVLQVVSSHGFWPTYCIIKLQCLWLSVCVNVCIMLVLVCERSHASKWPHPIDLWRDGLQTPHPLLAQRFFTGSARRFLCLLMFLRASSKLYRQCLYIGSRTTCLIYTSIDDREWLKSKKSPVLHYSKWLVWTLLFLKRLVRPPWEKTFVGLRPEVIISPLSVCVCNLRSFCFDYNALLFYHDAWNLLSCEILYD